MKVLITGAKGFIGKNLAATLTKPEVMEKYLFDVDTAPESLDEYTKACDFIFHLAGVNRSKNPEEFMEGNWGFTSTLIDSLKRNGNKAPILVTSSIQAEMDNPYGLSKKAGEEVVFSYGEENNIPVYVYRLPNVFGKWCRPNYNSAVATFCYNIAHDLPIVVNDPAVQMQLVYIDDVVAELIRAMRGIANQKDRYCYVEPVHQAALGHIAELIFSFRAARQSLSLPDLSDSFTKDLYAAYLSYLPEDQFQYPLKMNMDQRGSFTEIFRTPERGQVSVNVTRPGITKGNHWHHTKNEKFLVVSGKGVIRFRKVGEEKVLEYFVDGTRMEVVDIPTGYTHHIKNVGDTDLVTIMWASECFDSDKPDTYYLEV
jgi:UDP-2-acetamido-2,6-beta-L-arabino-hexul-4-ose reductase